MFAHTDVLTLLIRWFVSVKTGRSFTASPLFNSLLHNLLFCMIPCTRTGNTSSATPVSTVGHHGQKKRKGRAFGIVMSALIALTFAINVEAIHTYVTKSI